ncbi:MAG TPA: tRNA (N(6)-L-threonylcarbamoyladenosine(37)-C(2))-methylthiotransferase MtaB [Firmicutes bacterium]|nr:tRNA (N(6)-L-threonylcarbamoyladenosine(37)-C(2))-methylthiotransferase MtaB [Bacillota bacterium]
MKACVLTLGCKVNEAESDSLLAGLEARGWETATAPCPADLYLINTCAVTAEAERKSRQAVARLRKFNPSAPVIVCGCASQNAPQAFASRADVTLVTGTMRKDKILELLDEKGVFLETETAFCELPAPKRTHTRQNIRIQDGCDRFCSYCLIPYLRGRSRSRGIRSVLSEAQACGAREIVLTGIDITSYRDGAHDLGDLLLALKDVPARIRLGSLEEGIVTREFLEKMRSAGNVCEHFHLSLQSGSDAVLRAMNRRYTRAQYLEACALIGEYFPDAAVTTDLIVGFPTETEEDFGQSLSIVREAGLARVHAFPYSARPGTVAAKKKPLPDAVRRERMARMLACAREAEEAYLARFAGRTFPALFEEDGGYTPNYIRVYAEGVKEGGMYEVRLDRREKDGYHAAVIKEI